MWLPFIVWSTVLNAIFCVWVVGPSALSAVYRDASSRDLGLVCTFSFLWGSGTACFSLGVQLVSERTVRRDISLVGRLSRGRPIRSRSWHSRSWRKVAGLYLVILLQ